VTRPRLACLLAAAVAAVLALAACGGGGDAPAGAGSTATASTAPQDVSAQVMGAAVRRLVTRDHTFGRGDHRFTEYLVLSRTDPSAGSPGGPKTPARPLTAGEREAIAAAIAGRGPHRFIDDPAQGRTDDLQPVVAGSAIISVGEPEIGAATALAPASLWCGGLCGVWLTYRVDRVGDEWKVTGVEGPVAIS
jgi:hypothetical protein